MMRRPRSGEDILQLRWKPSRRSRQLSESLAIERSIIVTKNLCSILDR